MNPKMWSTLVSSMLMLSTLLVACGGGGGGGGTTPAIAPSSLLGVAATGAALANAPVTILDASGVSPCNESSLFTDAAGAYRCTLKPGAAAPFFIRVTDPTGASSALFSVATQTPAAGAVLTVNATPLTTAIVAQLSGGNAQTFFNSRSVDAAQLAAVTNNVVVQLGQVLSSIGLSSYDPFHTSITAATSTSPGSTSDRILDMVKVAANSSTGQMEFTVASSSTPIPVATAGAAGTLVPQPSATLSDLVVAAQAASQSWTQCLAQSASQRLSLGQACLNFVSSFDASTSAPDYVSRNRTFMQTYSNMLGNSALTASKVAVPSIVFMRTADSNAATWLEQHDWAVLNFTYVDNTGAITGSNDVFANIPGTATVGHPSTWWMVGNQQRVDVKIIPEIQRITQLNSNHTSGGGSSYLTGLNIVINSHQPNSSPSVDFKYAKVVGDGLPTAGLWLQIDPANSASRMSIVNGYTGTNPPSTTQSSVCVDCPVYWFAYTSGIDAQGSANYGPNWAGSDAAQGTDGSYNGVVGTRPRVGSLYTVQLYKATDGNTPSFTVRKFLATPVIDPKAGLTIPWNTFGPNALAAMDPAGNLAGVQAAITVDWIRNPAAQPVGDTYVAQSDGNVADGSFDNGATSVTVTATAPATIAAFSSSSGSRRIGLHYLMVDGSSKFDVVQYDH